MAFPLFYRRGEKRMTEYFVDLLNVLMPFIPSIAIKYYPLWKTRDLKARTVYLWTSFFLLLLSVGLFYVRRFYTVDLRVAQMYKGIISMPNLFIGFWVFRKRIWKNVVLIAVSFMYNAISTGIGNYAGENWFQAARYPLLSASIVSFIVVAFTLPPLLFLLQRLYENPYMKEAKVFWRYIWLMPMGFFCLTLLTGSPFDNGSFSGGFGFFLIRVIIYGALLLTCYLLEMAVHKVYEAETAKSESDELVRTNRFLDDLSNMKTEFFQNMSHELKTPLSVIYTDIYNAADYLDFEMDKEDMRASLEHAKSETLRMGQMVESALKYATMQKSWEESKPMEIAALLREGAENYRTILERNGNRLNLDIPQTLPLISGSADILLQVLSNLLSNANRHTRNGEISICAAAENEVVSVIVADTGTGINPELMPRVFERGVSDSGTGLGLSICKSAIEDMGGDISVISEYGEGAAITFTLPIYEEETENG
jgi:signal transduction histidine kinase